MAKSRAVRAESVWAALGGVLAGYILWLVAFSIGNALATVGVWGPIVLIGSVAFALGTTLWGRWLRRSGNLTLAAFALALPVLPVLLSLLLVADSYL
jgi:drug/metabolite transporter (DMT)-like permease